MYNPFNAQKPPNFQQPPQQLQYTRTPQILINSSQSQYPIQNQSRSVSPMQQQFRTSSHSSIQHPPSLQNSQYQTLQQRYRAALNDIDNLSSTNKKMKIDLEAFQQKIEFLQHQLNSEKQLRLKQINRITQTNETLSQKIKILKTLQTKLQNLITENSQLNTQKINLHTQNSILKSNKQQIQSNQQNLLKQLKNYKTSTIKLEIDDKNKQMMIQADRSKIKDMQQIVRGLQDSVEEWKKRFDDKVREYEGFNQLVPEEVLGQLGKLRAENQRIIIQQQSQTMNSIKTTDQQLLDLLKSFHEQLTTVRHENTTTKTYNEAILSKLHQQKAQSHLNFIKYQQQLELYIQQNTQLRRQIQTLNTQTKRNRKDQRGVRAIKQQRDLLQTKVFVLEALKIGQKYTGSRHNRELTEFQLHMQTLLETSSSNPAILQSATSLQNIVELHSIINTMDEKIQSLQLQLEVTTKKNKIYKQRYTKSNHHQKQSQQYNIQIISSYKQKIKNYDSLLEKFKLEMQKLVQMNIQSQKVQDGMTKVEQRFVEQYSREIHYYKKESSSLRVDLESKTNLIHLISEQKKLIQFQKEKLARSNRQYENKILSLQLQSTVNSTHQKLLEQIKQKNKQIIDLQRQLRQQAPQQTPFKQEQEDLRVLELRLELDRSRCQNYRLKHDNERISASVRESQDQIQVYRKKIEEEQKKKHLMKKSSTNYEESQNLRDQISKINYKYTEIASKYEDNTSEIEKLNYFLKLKESDIQELHNKIKTITQKNRLVQQKINEKQIEIFNQQKQYQILKLNHNILQQKFSNNQTTSNTHESQMQIQQLRNQLSNKKDSYDQLSNKLKQTEQQLSTLRIEHDKMYEQNLELIYKVQEKESNIKIQNYEKHDSDRQMNMKIIQYQNKIKIMEQQIERLNQVNKNTNKKLMQKQGSETNKVQEIQQQLQRRNIHFKQQLQKIYIERIGEKQVFDNEMLKLQGEMVSYKRYIQELQAQGWNQRYQQVIRQMDIEMGNYNQKIQQHQSEISYLKRDIKDLRQENVRLRVQSNEKNVEEKQLRDNMHANMQKIYEQSNVIRNLQTEISVLKVKQITDDQPQKQGLRGSGSYHSYDLQDTK